MLTVPPFDSTQVKILKSFLDAPERSPDSMGYAEAAGFLFALACAPELVEPSEWLVIVIDPDNAAEASLESKKSITASLMSLYNEMTHQVKQDEVQLPPDVGFLDDSMANLEPDASVSQWARGFRSGYFLLEQIWADYIPEEIKEEFGYQVTVLSFFSSQSLAKSLYEEVDNKEETFDSLVDNMQRIFPDALNGVAGLGNTIHQMIAARGNTNQQPVAQSHKIGRNEPCPCGSGKKFKKCCGPIQH